MPPSLGVRSSTTELNVTFRRMMIGLGDRISFSVLKKMMSPSCAQLTKALRSLDTALSAASSMSHVLLVSFNVSEISCCVRGHPDPAREIFVPKSVRNLSSYPVFSHCFFVAVTNDAPLKLPTLHEYSRVVSIKKQSNNYLRRSNRSGRRHSQMRIRSIETACSNNCVISVSCRSVC